MFVRLKEEYYEPKELEYIRCTYVLELPSAVTMETMGIKRSYYFRIKKETEEKMEKQQRKRQIMQKSLESPQK